jgi:hypothetical protein
LAGGGSVGEVAGVRKPKIKLVDWSIGTKVQMVNCLEAEKHGDKVWITRSDPWMLCGSQVVLLEGKSGGFDTSCLEVVK